MTKRLYAILSCTHRDHESVTQLTEIRPKKGVLVLSVLQIQKTADRQGARLSNRGLSRVPDFLLYFLVLKSLFTLTGRVDPFDEAVADFAPTVVRPLSSLNFVSKAAILGA
ncbi:hypothetical protein BaRGS_00018349 [Batillaria attramentaria]|uniref:Uncharacterized protein n=1 Tax=Batillaria attramentaria TaxID=370345 RepID=A0ABD0KT56_9CAEN